MAIVDGRGVGYHWFCVKLKHIEEIYGYVIPIPSDYIFAYDSFVLPDYRRKKVWSQLIAASSDIMVENSKNNMAVLIEYGNETSMNAYVKFGFSPVKSIFYIGIFGLKLFKSKDIKNNKL